MTSAYSSRSSSMTSSESRPTMGSTSGWTLISVVPLPTAFSSTWTLRRRTDSWVGFLQLTSDRYRASEGARHIGFLGVQQRLVQVQVRLNQSGDDRVAFAVDEQVGAALVCLSDPADSTRV